MRPKLLRDAMQIIFFCILGHRRSCTPDPRQTKKERNKVLPKPLRSSRKPISLNHMPTEDVRVPLLAKLPIETRRHIYNYVLGDHLIHLLLVPSRVTHVCCTRHTPTDHERKCYPSSLHRIVPVSVFRPPSPISINFLRTCCQIYTEALPILYSTNTFDIDDLSAYNFFAGAIPTAGLSSIKSLHINWNTEYPPLEFDIATQAPYDDSTYKQFWRTVATQMPALKELRLHIASMFWTNNIVEELDSHWLRPLKQVRGLEVFEVEIMPASGRYPRDPNETEQFANELRRIMCSEKGEERMIKADIQRGNL